MKQLVDKAKVLDRGAALYAATCSVKHDCDQVRRSCDDRRIALQASFAADVVLLKHIGLRPVIVHGGGPQIAVPPSRRMGRQVDLHRRPPCDRRRDDGSRRDGPRRKDQSGNRRNSCNRPGGSACWLTRAATAVCLRVKQEADQRPGSRDVWGKSPKVDPYAIVEAIGGGGLHSGDRADRRSTPGRAAVST